MKRSFIKGTVFAGAFVLGLGASFAGTPGTPAKPPKFIGLDSPSGPPTVTPVKVSPAPKKKVLAELPFADFNAAIKEAGISPDACSIESQMPVLDLAEQPETDAMASAPACADFHKFVCGGQNPKKRRAAVRAKFEDFEREVKAEFLQPQAKSYVLQALAESRKPGNKKSFEKILEGMSPGTSLLLSQVDTTKKEYKEVFAKAMRKLPGASQANDVLESAKSALLSEFKSISGSIMGSVEQLGNKTNSSGLADQKNKVILDALHLIEDRIKSVTIDTSTKTDLCARGQEGALFVRGAKSDTLVICPATLLNASLGSDASLMSAVAHALAKSVDSCALDGLSVKSANGDLPLAMAAEPLRECLGRELGRDYIKPLKFEKSDKKEIFDGVRIANQKFAMTPGAPHCPAPLTQEELTRLKSRGAVAARDKSTSAVSEFFAAKILASQMMKKDLVGKSAQNYSIEAFGQFCSFDQALGNDIAGSLEFLSGRERLATIVGRDEVFRGAVLDCPMSKKIKHLNAMTLRDSFSEDALQRAAAGIRVRDFPKELDQVNSCKLRFQEGLVNLANLGTGDAAKTKDMLVIYRIAEKNAGVSDTSVLEKAVAIVNKHDENPKGSLGDKLAVVLGADAIKSLGPDLPSDKRPEPKAAPATAVATAEKQAAGKVVQPAKGEAKSPETGKMEVALADSQGWLAQAGGEESERFAKREAAMDSQRDACLGELKKKGLDKPADPEDLPDGFFEQFEKTCKSGATAGGRVFYDYWAKSPKEVDGFFVGCEMRCRCEDSRCFMPKVKYLGEVGDKKPTERTIKNVASDLAFLMHEDAKKGRNGVVVQACFAEKSPKSKDIASDSRCRGATADKVVALDGGTLDFAGERSGAKLSFGCTFECKCGQDPSACEVVTEAKVDPEHLDKVAAADDKIKRTFAMPTAGKGVIKDVAEVKLVTKDAPASSGLAGEVPRPGAGFPRSPEADKPAEMKVAGGEAAVEKTDPKVSETKSITKAEQRSDISPDNGDDIKFFVTVKDSEVKDSKIRQWISARNDAEKNATRNCRDEFESKVFKKYGVSSPAEFCRKDKSDSLMLSEEVGADSTSTHKYRFDFACGVNCSIEPKNGGARIEARLVRQTPSVQAAFPYVDSQIDELRKGDWELLKFHAQNTCDEGISKFKPATIKSQCQGDAKGLFEDAEATYQTWTDDTPWLGTLSGVAIPYQCVTQCDCDPKKKYSNGGCKATAQLLDVNPKYKSKANPIFVPKLANSEVRKIASANAESEGSDVTHKIFDEGYAGSTADYCIGDFGSTKKLSAGNPQIPGWRVEKLKDGNAAFMKEVWVPTFDGSVKARCILRVQGGKCDSANSRRCKLEGEVKGKGYDEVKAELECLSCKQD